MLCKFWWLSVVSLAIAGPLSTANAADMPLKAPAMAPAAYDWSGIYIGGNVGGGWAQNEISDPGLGIVGTLLGVPVTQTTNSSGFLGGVEAGANYQIGKLVVGTEVDWDWTGINGTGTSALSSPLLVLPPGVAINRSLGANTDWTGTATTRIGIAHDHWLFYGKVGAAWAHTKYTDNWNVTGAMLPAGINPLFSGTGSSTRTGWTVGTGIEYAFWNSWSAKLEYDYMNFGSPTTTINGTILPASGFGIPFSAGLQNNQQISEVKFGLNYKIMPNFW
jgi:outer membrane immunogenic protein